MVAVQAMAGDIYMTDDRICRTWPDSVEVGKDPKVYRRCTSSDTMSTVHGP